MIHSADDAASEPKLDAEKVPNSAVFGLVLCGLMIVFVLFGPMILRNQAAKQVAESPHQTVQRWITAQQAGDLETLQLLASDAVHEDLTRRLRQGTTADVARQLQQELAGLQGFRYEPAIELSPGHLQIPMQLVYDQIPQRGVFELKQREQIWYISRIAIERVVPPATVTPANVEPSVLIRDR